MSQTISAQPRELRPDIHEVRRDRNRAIDAYRALAMVGVAFGHWLAADVRQAPAAVGGRGGGLTGGNALNHLTNLHALTWIFQVMPLFFCIGGFSNAASLTAHWRRGNDSPSWVAARLYRLAAPSALLAGFWFGVLSLTGVLGIGADVAKTAAGVAAIPLWFLANYVVDTAVAPVTLRLFRDHRRPFVATVALVFLLLDALRFWHVRFLPQGNIVLGWMCFQILGFAWRDGLLPSPKLLSKLSIGFLSVAAALVAFGPWPLAMVSVPGGNFANTWPPSLALLVFGMGYCAAAIAAAPQVAAFLERSRNAWSLVVAANSVAMTSYLWHFNALIIAAGIALPLGLLPTATVGSAHWWTQKLVVLAISLAVLLVLLATVGRKERSSLMSAARPIAPKRYDHILSMVLVLALAAGFEIWTSAEGGSRPMLLVGSGLVLVVRGVLGLRQRVD